MNKNLKIDIIYYNSPSDFEFEFNLGGYCRSRILNAKASSLKDMITKLAIAVTRSRVIIIIGSLLGENGCILPVAKSISKEIVNIDHRKYHITSPEPISIIEGSLPLVTADGQFGGCIIESGPQSIIFLTQDKSTRTKLTEELVSHYLISLSQTSDSENDIIIPENTSSENVSNENITDENISEEKDSVSENETENEQDNQLDNNEENSDKENISLEGTDDFSNIQQDTENTEIYSDLPQEDKELNDLQESDNNNEDNQSDILDSKPIKDNDDEMKDSENSDSYIIPLVPDQTKYQNNFFDNDEASLEYEVENESNAPKKQKSKMSSLSKAFLILTAVFLVIAALLVYFLVYMPRLNNINITEYFKEIFTFYFNLL